MNVIFIVVDDMNDYGFYNTYPGVKMPYLDAYKKTALIFDKAYCPSPVCCPSRSSFYSGLYPHTTGAYYNGHDGWRKSSILKNVETIPECFKRNDYITFGRGKLFHAVVPEERDSAMWDNYPVYRGGFKPFPEPEDQQFEGNRFFAYKAWKGPDSDFPDIINTDAAIEFLQQDHDKPFFLSLGLWRPHTPFTAPKRFFDMYNIDDMPDTPPGYLENDLDDVPELGKKLVDIWGRFEMAGKNNIELWKEFVMAYCACNTFVDWNVGRMLDVLQQSPYADDTAVFFFSDNGYHCGEKSHWEKATLWEQAARVPLFIRVPGMTPENISCKRPVNLVDIYPTLIELCQINKPTHEMDGNSLVPLFKNPETQWDIPSLTTYGEKYTSLRTEQYHYIQYPDGSGELYNHNNDTFEFENIIHDTDYDQVIKSLEKWIPQKWTPSIGGRNG